MSSPSVIFDMDGLLLDTERLCLSCFVETRRHFALPDCPEIFLQCVGLSGDQSGEIIRNSLSNPADYADFSQLWREKIGAALAHDVPLKPGARELVERLAAKGTLMAVATSTKTDPARTELQRAGLLTCFSAVIGGDQVTERKPDSEIYHKAAAALGQTASACIAFEDSEAGTRAALASGALTVQIPDLVAPSDSLRAQGHIIAPTLLDGARQVGLIDMPESQR